MNKVAIQEISTMELVRTSNGSKNSNEDVIKDGTREINKKPGVYRLVELVNDKVKRVLPVVK